MIEKWDAYDKYFNKIADGSLIRGEVIPDGVYHLVGEIIVKHIYSCRGIIRNNLVGNGN